MATPEQLTALKELSDAFSAGEASPAQIKQLGELLKEINCL